MRSYILMMSRIEEVKKSAEKCMKEEKYAEAFFHWTKAIHLMPKNSSDSHADLVKIFAQRAKCFMQTEQFYYAKEDANKVLEMDPKNALGHLRLAEVYYETGHFLEALPLIGKCFSLTSGKAEQDYLLEWQKKCRKNAAKQKLKDEQLPFVGAAIGIVIASLGVVADALAYGSSSYVAHPVLKALIVIGIAGTCYLIAVVIRRNTQNNRKSLLLPPIDLLNSGGSEKSKSD